MNSVKLFLLITFFCRISADGQVVNYSFDGTILGLNNKHNLSYLKLGKATTDVPKYESSPSGKQILVDSTHGLQFPVTFNTEIDTTSGFELEMKFSFPSLGAVSRVHILSCQKEHISFEGFSIYLQRDVTSKNYSVNFVYTDGGSKLGVPNHPIFTSTSLGNFNEADTVNLRLYFNFKNRVWDATVNGKSYGAKVNDFYNWSSILTAIKVNKWYIHWMDKLETVVPGQPNNFTDRLSVDQLTVFVPKRPYDTSGVRTALQMMTDYVNQKITLTTSQRETNVAIILADFKNVFSGIRSDVYSYVKAHEQHLPVLFKNRNTVSFASMSPEDRLMITLQQYILDEEFVLGNIKNVEGIKFKFADLFPGKIDSTAARVSKAKVSINGTHIHVPASTTAFDKDPAKRPTGYYAAPGEVISITIPDELINKGLLAQIGVHSDDLSKKRAVNRFVRITKSFELKQKLTLIANPLGGPIYIKVPEPSNLSWFEVEISGAIKSPYFSLRKGRESSITEWEEQLNAHDVEWVDLESDKYMMTLPWENVKTIKDPTYLLTEWNRIMDGYNFLGGRPSAGRSKAEYFAVDCVLPNDGAFGIGYPQIIGEASAPYGPLSQTDYYPTQILKANFYKSSLDVTFHEMGHAAAHPKMTREIEAIVEMYSTYIYNELYGVPLNEAYKYSGFQLMELDDAAIDWIVTDNFKRNIDMTCDPILEKSICDEVRYQHRGYAKYIEMAKQFGWSSVHGMNKVFYEQDLANPPSWWDIFKSSDEIIQAASDAQKVNMAPLFHFWGLAPSKSLAEKLKAQYGFSEKLCQMLRYYKTIVPKTSVQLKFGMIALIITIR